MFERWHNTCFDFAPHDEIPRKCNNPQEEHKHAHATHGQVSPVVVEIDPFGILSRPYAER